MRIALDAKFTSYELRGMGKYIDHLVRDLPAAAPQHEFVIYADPARYPRSPSNVTFRNPGRLPYPVWEQFVLPLWVTQDSVDLLHCPANTAPLFLPAHVRLVVTIHDVMYLLPPSVYPPPTIWRQRLGNLYRRVVVPRIVSRAVEIITISEFSKTQIVEWLAVAPQVVTAILQGGDSKSSSEELVEGDPTCFDQPLSGPFFLALGSHDPRKNTAAIIKAYAAIGPSLPNGEKLVIVGLRGWRESGFYELVRSLGVEKHVWFADYISTTDLQRLYRRATAFLFPSQYEGFGFPVVEAMAAATPVICSNVTCIPEIAGDAAILVDPHSHDDLAKAMLRVASDPHLRDRLSAAGKARARLFTWEKLVRSTIQVYDRIDQRQRPLVAADAGV